MDGIDLSGGTFRTTLLSYNNELLTSSVKLPGGDSVIQSFTSVHGESKVTSPAGYHAYVYRSYQLDTLGRVARMADSIFKGSEYDRAYAFNSSGRLAGVTFGTTSSCGFNSDYGWVVGTVDSAGFRGTWFDGGAIGPLPSGYFCATRVAAGLPDSWMVGLPGLGPSGPTESG